MKTGCLAEKIASFNMSLRIINSILKKYPSRGKYRNACQKVFIKYNRIFIWDYYFL
jgi:hypothetical protein